MTKKELEQNIIDLWEKQFSRRAISRVLNVPRTTVRRFVSRLIKDKVIKDIDRPMPAPTKDGKPPFSKLKKDDIIWMSNNTCKHNKTYIEHYQCFLDENPARERTCYFDIETSGLQATFGIILSACILDDTTNETHSFIISKDDLASGILDRRVVSEIIAKLQEFDRVLTYYGTRFDLPYLRSRAVYHNLEFPTFQTILHTDVYFLVRNKFKLHSNRLDAACEFLLGGTKKTRIESKYWLGALQGNADCLAYIDDHCRKDVAELKRLYDRIKQFHGQRDNSI